MQRKGQKNPPAPRKPKPPKQWEYPKELILDFFWSWLESDFDPMFTPDGKPWFDQDPVFWALVNYVRDLWRWAEKRAERPVMQIRRGDQGMADL